MMDVVEQITGAIGSGVGLAMLALAIGVHATFTAKWAGRIEEALALIREELPNLRASRHEHANILSVHKSQLAQGEKRMEAHSVAMGELRAQIGNIPRVEERLIAMNERQARFEVLMERILEQRP